MWTDIWVDASTSWHIGVVVGEHWATCKLNAGWKSEGRDISWAESVALEIAVLWVIEESLLDSEVKI